MEPVRSEEIAPQPREVRAGLLHAEIVSDILSVVPTMALTDIRFLSPFQITTFVRYASLVRARERITQMVTYHVSGDARDAEFKALQRQVEEIAYEPRALPEKALQQQREYEDRKRRGDTFRQRATKSRQFVLNPAPKRERFSIRRKLGAVDAGAEGTPHRILNAQLPKGIRI